MTPPNAPGTGGIPLPPRPGQTQEQHQKQHDSERAQQKTSSDKISRTELEIALQAQRAEQVANNAMAEVSEVRGDVKDIKSTVIKMEAQLNTLTAAKEAKRSYRLAYIGGAFGIVVAAITVGIPACQSLKKDMVTKAGNEGKDEVDRKAMSTEQIRRAALNEQGRALIIQTMQEIEQQNKARGLVLVPSSMIVSGKPP